MNEVVIRDKRMANTIKWICGEHYEERQHWTDPNEKVYVFKNKNLVLTVLDELKELRIKHGVISA